MAAGLAARVDSGGDPETDRHACAASAFDAAIVAVVALRSA